MRGLCTVSGPFGIAADVVVHLRILFELSRGLCTLENPFGIVGDTLYTLVPLGIV